MKRIRILVSILCACLVSVAWSQQPAGKGHINWAQFHRQNMMRWNPYEHVLNVNNVGKLRLKWTFKTGSKYSASPAVANGVVYVGSYDGKVHALKASNGAELWSYTASHVLSSPVVANGVVYVGSSDGKLYALDASIGTLLWSYSTGLDVNSSPAVANGVVYVGSFDGKLYALEARIGTLLWSYTIGGWVESSPSVANGVVYIAPGHHQVNAFGLKKGRK